MGNLSRENIEWASQALSDGRSLEFVASILEVRPRKAQTIIDAHLRSVSTKAARKVKIDGPHVWRASPEDTSAARKSAEKFFASDSEPVETEEPKKRGRPAAPETRPDSTLQDRRRFLLAARFARHWDMI